MLRHEIGPCSLRNALMTVLSLTIRELEIVLFRLLLGCESALFGVSKIRNKARTSFALTRR